MTQLKGVSENMLATSDCSWAIGESAQRKRLRVLIAGALHDSNVMGSPGQITVLFEATTAVAAMLERQPLHVPDRPPPRHNEKAPLGNMSARDWYEHLVVIGS